MKHVQIKNKTMEVPIIQGGMGVGVSLGGLAGAVMAEGGMGCISAANPGFKRDDFFKKPNEANLTQFALEIKKARAISASKGLLAVNIMVAGSTYTQLVKQAVESGVDAIISGAGLPLELPQLVAGSDVAIAPIVSSAKAASLICRSWERKHGVLPDFIVIEGSEAGGHLGFSKEELVAGTQKDLQTILHETIEVVRQIEERIGRKIPIFVAGGIFDGHDIAKYIEAGADGVQMGTRFIGTHECDAPASYKQQFIEATPSDIVLTRSPAGLPGRAMANSFVQKLATVDRLPPNWCINCLKPCKPRETVYCISEALINAVQDKVADGLVFTGTNGYKIEKLASVKEVIKQLTHDFATATGGSLV